MKSKRQNGTIALPPREMFPFQSRFFSIGPNKLHYVDEGSGPVVILLHSCPFWSYEFRALIEDLRRDHRVLAIDQMGFGLSGKPRHFDYRIEAHVDHLERFIRVLGLKDFTLVMHGRGAAIGMAGAIRHPEDVKGFVTLNAMSFSNYYLPWRLQLCRLKWIGAKIVMNLRIFQRDFDKLPKAIRAGYYYPFPTRRDQESVLHFIEDLPSAPEDPSAQTMFEIESSLWLLRDKPCCIIWGRKDWLYTMRNFRTWTQYFPLAEKHVIDKAGRTLMEDAPVEICDYIRDFLEKNGL
ncbi:MAG: alpha/beta fold hydrolase [Lentisphaeria bacterium]|nr:alpha/beta fold hydrolase [Lentisphaeria bacterium]